MIPFDHSVPAAIDAVDNDVASTLSLCTSLSSSCLSSSSLLTATIPTATTIPTTARTSIYQHHQFQFHVRSLQHEVRRLQQQRRRLMLLVMCLIVMAIVGSTTTDHIWWSASQQQGMNRSVVIVHRLEHGGNTTATTTATTTTTPTKTKTATATATSTTTTNTAPLLLRGGHTAAATASSSLSFGTQNDTTGKTTQYTSSFEQNGTSSSSSSLSSATESYESPHHGPLLPFIAIAGWHDSRDDDDHDDYDDDDDDDDNNSININNDDAGLSWRWDSWSLSWYTTTMRRFVNNNNTGYNNINSKNLTIATTTSSSSAAAAAAASSSSNTITRQQQHQQHQRQHQQQHQSIRLLPPLYVLRQYQQQHSVSVLRTELERQDGNGAQYLRQERQYVIAKFQCPYQAGMMSLPIQNGLLLAIVTNRTFILRYEGANGNIEANCRSILQFADWVPTYKEFGSIITADYHYEAGSPAKKRTNQVGSGTKNIKRKEKSKKNLLLVNPVHTRGSLQQPYFNKTEWAPEPLMASDFAPSACHRFKKEYEQRDRNGHDDDDDHAELSSWWYNSKRNQTWLSLLLEGSDDHIVVDPTDQQPPEEEEAIVAKNRFSHTLLAQARVWKVSRIYIPSTSTRFWLDLREPCTAYRIPMLMDNNTKAGVISPMLPPLHLQQQVQQLYQQGIGFLFGMLFYSVVRIQPTVVDSISPSDWVLSSTSASSIAMHSRHSDVTLSGEDISTEKACLDYLITATTTTTTSTSTTKPTTVSDQQQPSDVIANPKTSLQSCHVHLMSDRPVTVQRVAAYAHDRYHCQALYTHNATPTNSFRASAEHGPAAGVGYYQDLLVVAAQARSAYMSHFRSSSFLPYATLEYTRRLAAWQQHLQQLQQHQQQQQQQHREKGGNLDVDDDVADDEDDNDDDASTDPWTWPNMPLCHLGNGRPFEIL